MGATLITRFKDITAEGGVIELVVWRVAEPIAPSIHPFKYRAVYAVGGVRLVGFDNERGKGDHWHLRDQERAYEFSTVEKLIEDFIAAVAAARSVT
jgi:hypothetical protein